MQVIADGTVQVKATAPLKLFTEDRLMVSAALLPAARGMMLESGTMREVGVAGSLSECPARSWRL